MTISQQCIHKTLKNRGCNNGGLLITDFSMMIYWTDPCLNYFLAIVALLNKEKGRKKKRKNIFIYLLIYLTDFKRGNNTVTFLESNYLISMI